MTSNKTSRLIAGTTLFLLIWTLLVGVSFCLMPHHDGLYFRSPVLNGIALFSAFLAPTLILILLSWCPIKLPLKLLLGVLVFPFAAVGLLISIFASIEVSDMIKTGEDSSHELIRSAPLGSATLTAYRTNGGAMTDFGVALEREYFILPGLKWVRSAEYTYHADKVEFIRLNENEIRCLILPTNNGLGKDITVSAL